MNDPENPMDLDKIFKKVYIFEKSGGFEKLDHPSSIFYSILFDPNKFRMIVSGSNIKLNVGTWYNHSKFIRIK